MRIRKFSVGIVGIVLLGTAIFAEQLGMDNDAGWGNGRRLLFGLGIILVAANLLGVIFRNKLLKLAKPVTNFSNQLKELSYSTQLGIFSFLFSMVVFGTYIWFFMPYMTQSTTDYYSQLAIAFKANQLHLLEQPPASLLALSDPYDYHSRKEIEEDFTWDVSLYKGKFYLYWGPVPSLILTVFSSEQLARIGDQYVFFIFVCGLFIYSAVLVRNFWGTFNQFIPAWIIGISLLAIGLSGPTIWMIITPRIYEAAVVGSQFFFIGGCFWAYLAICASPPSFWKLALAASHWALAIGTRITVLPAVIFLAVLTFFYLWREARKTDPQSIPSIWLTISLPLLFALAGLGLYNWLRFDSLFESGFRYQLANVNYTEFTGVFSVGYMDKNLFNYFILPVDIQAKFPYLRPVENVFSNARLAGLLYTTPYFLFIGMSLIRYLYLSSRSSPLVQQGRKFQESWLVIGLTGSTVLSLAIVLTYYFPALRFAGDFMPAALLLATLCLGRGYELLSGNRIISRSYTLLVTILVIISAVVSILVAIPINRTGSILLLIKIIQQWLGLR